MSLLAGKVALITGSSRGIGAAIAREFAKEGASVALHGRDRAALAEVANVILSEGVALKSSGEEGKDRRPPGREPRVIQTTGDVTSFADIEAMRAEIGRKVIEITADESKNLRTLAQTYSNLTPKGAVAILREMDDTTVVKILSLMKSDAVGPIFEEMAKTTAPDGTLARRAALLSEKLRLMKAARSPS